MNWKANFFKLPSGSVGKTLIVECNRLLDQWTNKTTHESIALTALFIFLPLVMQKPSKSSKNKDHVSYLKKRVEAWEKGDFDTLLAEDEA